MSTEPELTIGQRITGLLKAVHEHKTSHAVTSVYLKRSEELYAEMDKIDQEAGEGLAIGRVVKWPHADGYAYYFVLAIAARIVTLKHIPIGDAWHNPVIPQNGKITKKIVEDALRKSDKLKRLFQKKK